MTVGKESHSQTIHAIRPIRIASESLSQHSCDSPVREIYDTIRDILGPVYAICERW